MNSKKICRPRRIHDKSMWRLTVS